MKNIFFIFCLLPCLSFCNVSVSDLTLEEKVGQLLMANFQGEVANEDARRLVEDIHVGHIIFYNFSNGLSSPEEVATLCKDLQKIAKDTHHALPLNIAVDQEGGVVARLTKGFTVFPGNKALSMTNDPSLAKKSALIMGKEMRAVGVTMNLAPVVDINNNPKNPVIGIRSYGDSLDTVLSFANEALDGFHEAGVITCLKHFPGHGDVATDSHEDLPVIRKSKKELLELELCPFFTLAKKTDAIMTAHILTLALDPYHPATLSKNTLSLLRQEGAFDGIIISDSIVMEGVLKSTSSVEEASIQALEAGCDIVCLGGKALLSSKQSLELTVNDVERIHASIVQAVRKGRLSEARIDQSVQKVLNVKQKYDLLSEKPFPIASKESIALSQKIADLAIRSIIKKPLPPLSSHKIAVIAPKLVQEPIQESGLLQLGKDSAVYFFSSLNPTDDEKKDILQMAKDCDVILFSSINAWKNEAQASLVSSLLQMKKPVILLALRDPSDVSLWNNVDVAIATCSPTKPSIQAACHFLQAMK